MTLMMSNSAIDLISVQCLYSPLSVWFFMTRYSNCPEGIKGIYLYLSLLPVNCFANRQSSWNQIVISNILLLDIAVNMAMTCQNSTWTLKHSPQLTARVHVTYVPLVRFGFKIRVVLQVLSIKYGQIDYIWIFWH